MKLGYPVISHTLAEKGVTPYRKIEGALPQQMEIYLQNLKDLLETLKWNESQGIRFYRVSNTFGHQDDKIFENEEILSMLKEVGEYATSNGHRLSFHCSHYAVLGSPKASVRFGARNEIESLSRFFDLLGFEPSQWNKLNVHVGGAYGDKDKAVQDWMKSWEKLSDSAKSRLVLENDDKASLFSVRYLYENVHKVIGVPITFDSFHHNFCNENESKEEAAKLAASTWKTEPCFHFASSRKINEENSLQTAHADWIYEEIQDWGTGAWTMIESVGRDLALLRYINEGVSLPKKEILHD
jgi:UV DNA damage endonuclease